MHEPVLALVKHSTLRREQGPRAPAVDADGKKLHEAELLFDAGLIG